MSAVQLRVGCWSFTATADLGDNAASIRAGIAAAAAAQVRVLLTPECALTGYPGAARAGLADLPSCALADTQELLLAEAERAGIALVLGSASGDGAGGWTNDAIALGACYRKRCLTPHDESNFRAGTKAVTMVVDGWRLGLAICYDVRFPHVWNDLAQLDVDSNLMIGHMAGVDPDPGTKAAVIPAFCSVRAAETATPLVFCNTAAADRWLDSASWDARGVQTTVHGPGLMVTSLIPRRDWAPWYSGVRATYLAQVIAAGRETC